MKRNLIKLISIITLVLCQISYAAAGLLFNVTSSGIAINISTVRPNHTYPNAGIKINTPGYTLKNAGTECIPNANGYCLFSTSDTLPASITILGSVGTIKITLCLDGAGPLSCQYYNVPRSVPRFAYVANGGNNTVSVCALNSDGSLGTCGTTTGNGTFSFGGEGGGTGITLNSAHTIAYVTNYNNNTVSICPINPNGTFGTCTTSDGNGTFNQPDGSMAFNSRNKLAYVPNCGGNSVSICPVNPNGTFGACAIADGNGTFQCATQVTFNSAATLAYVANQSTTISICPVNPNGSFGTCTTSDGNGTFENTQGVDFNVSETFAYIGNFANNTVSICPVNNNGTLGTCSATAGTPNFDFSNNLVICLFMSSLTNVGYIPNNGNNTVSLCPINTSDGSLGACTTTTGNGTFNQPSAVTLG